MNNPPIKLSDEERQVIRDAFKQTRILNRRPNISDEISKKGANISVSHQGHRWQEGEK